jgi:hypothetical protein
MLIGQAVESASQHGAEQCKRRVDHCNGQLLALKLLITKADFGGLSTDGHPIQLSGACPRLRIEYLTAFRGICSGIRKPCPRLRGLHYRTIPAKFRSSRWEPWIISNRSPGIGALSSDLVMFLRGAARLAFLSRRTKPPGIIGKFWTLSDRRMNPTPKSGYRRGEEIFKLFPIDAQYDAPCFRTRPPIEPVCQSLKLPKSNNNPTSICNANPCPSRPVPWYLKSSVSQPGSPLLFLFRFPLFLELLQFCLR